MQSSSSDFAEFQEQLDTAIQRIRTITDSTNPEALICAFWLSIALAPADAISDATHGTAPLKTRLAAFYTRRRTGATAPGPCTPAVVQQFADDIETAFLGYLFQEMPPTSDVPTATLAARLSLQSRIVSGSAFPEQTERTIREIQGHFDRWFTYQAGLTPNLICDVMWAIIRCHEHNALRLKNACLAKARAESIAAPQEPQLLTKKARRQRRRDNKLREVRAFQTAMALGALESIPVSLADVAAALPNGLDEESWSRILECFGADADAIERAISVRDLKRLPLLVLSDSRVLLTDISNAFDVVWDFFESAARKDQKFYEKRYKARRARWLESAARTAFTQCFPADCIYSNVVYDDPNHSNATAELDVLIKWGSFVVFCECKSAQFRFEQYPNDWARFRTDIKKNVEDPFDQARRARDYLTRSDSAVFRERCGDRYLQIDPKTIDRIYLTTVSLHHLAGTVTCLANLDGLGLFQSKEYPFALSVADLEVICRFCDGPDVLLHYIEQRLRLLKTGADYHADDLDLFGAYLDTRLVLKDIDPRIGEHSFVSFAGYTENFDKWYRFLRGELPLPPEIRLNLPELIRDVLAELRQRRDSDARYIAFALLGLSRAELEALAYGFESIRAMSPNPGLVRRLEHIGDDMAIVLLKFPEDLVGEMGNHVPLRAIAEKHRLKKSICIGFGFSPSSLLPFDCAYWLEGDHEPNEELDRLSAHSPIAIPIRPQALPGRNDPCFCGSGVKFKKCCLLRIY